MDWFKLKRIAARASLTAIILLVGVAGTLAVDRMRTRSELDEILSTYLSNEVWNNVPDWLLSRGIQVVIQREAQPPGMKFRWALPFDSRARFAEASVTTRFDFVLANLFPTNIRANLRLPRGAEPVFITSSDLEAPESDGLQRRFPNNIGYFAVSQPGVNLSGTEAIIHIDHVCGLCGHGGYLLLRKTNGHWKIVDEHGVWIS